MSQENFKPNPMTDKTREAIWRLINQCVDDVVSITEKEKNPYASEAAYKAIAQDTLDRIASLITAQADGVSDEPAYLYAHGIARVLHDVHLRSHGEFMGGDTMMDVLRQIDSMIYQLSLRSKLAQPKQDGCVTDDDIQAEALSYAAKPLAPYLRSEVFADGAKWGISKLAAPKTD